MALAGGGTGGHVYPCLAVARALAAETAARGEPLDLLYIGVRGRVDETIVPRAGIPFRAIAAGPMRVATPLLFARNLLRLAAGTVQSLWILLRYRPDAVFATGGYASVPVGIAARLLRRPLVVELPDVTPGWAVRMLARLATRMTTTSERALDRLPRGKTVVTGYPVRDEFRTLTREEARARLGIEPGEKMLLVTAGSLGAQRINDAVGEALPLLLPRCIVLHIAGPAEEQRMLDRREALAPAEQARYRVHGYTDDMAAAMLAADLVVSRAGASALGELPAAGVASILVPGEYEGGSQAPNAEFMQDRGAAIVLRNEGLPALGAAVAALLDDDARRGAMAQAARALARPNATRDIARVVLEVAA